MKKYGPRMHRAEYVIGRVCIGQECNGPKLLKAEFEMGRDLPESKFHCVEIENSVDNVTIHHKLHICCSQQ